MLVLPLAFAEDTRTDSRDSSRTEETTPEHEPEPVPEIIVSTDVLQTPSSRTDSRVASTDSSSTREQDSTIASTRTLPAPACNDFCRANIHYTGKLTARGVCEYAQEQCEQGCNTQTNKCNPAQARIPAQTEQRTISRDTIKAMPEERTIPKQRIPEPLRETTERKTEETIEQTVRKQLRPEERIIAIDTAVQGGKKVYNVKTEKPVRLFGIINMKMPVTTLFDSEMQERGFVKPWWSFLVKEQEQQEEQQEEQQKEQEQNQKQESKSECNNNADCLKYEDGNLCNGVLYCDKTILNEYKCKINPATTVSCYPSANQCQTRNCNPKTGQCEILNRPDSTKCSTGYHACVKGDHCQNGECTMGEWDYTDPECQCKTDSDCAKYETEDLCDAQLFCNKATKKCEANEATKAHCPSGNDNQCLKNTCRPATGKCEMTSVFEEEPCDDGNPCTQGDACKSGLCAGGKNTCQCKEDIDCKPLDDGDLCNGILLCSKEKGMCEPNPASIVKCPTSEDNSCRKNTCSPETGKCTMKLMPTGTACMADKDACTKDYCEKGICRNDAFDYSNPACECQNDADCAKYDDGKDCNGTPACNKLIHQCVTDMTNSGKC